MSHFTPEHWNTFAKRIRESKDSDAWKRSITLYLCEVFKEDNPNFNPDIFIQRALPDFVKGDKK